MICIYTRTISKVYYILLCVCVSVTKKPTTDPTYTLGTTPFNHVSPKCPKILLYYILYVQSANIAT